MSRKEICFAVNGIEKVIADPDPSITLLYYLRKHLRLTGTKEACGQGGCGACTVMVSKYDKNTDKLRNWSVNLCLTPICTLDGLAVTTIEGLGSTRSTSAIHPCQESIARGHGSQCGYCTPGMVMSVCTLLHNNQKPTEVDIEESIHGNLCRCTGYRPILDSFRDFCTEGKVVDLVHNYPLHKFKPTHTTGEPLYINGPSGVSWYRPNTLEQLFTLKDKYPNSEYVAGGISLGLQLNKQVNESTIYIALSHIPELSVVRETDEGLMVGAMVTISQLEEQLQEIIQKLTDTKVKRLKALLDMLALYAGPQIKNVATIGGNVMMDPLNDINPVSDIMTVLVGIKACAQIMSKESQREVVLNTIDNDKILLMNDKEILVSILIPLSKENEHVAVFKQKHRKHFDTSIVNACLSLTVLKGEISDCHLVYGGLNRKGPSVAIERERKMIGKKLNNELLTMICHSLSEELTVDTSVMKDYKINLCLSFFFKFYLQVMSNLGQVLSEKDKSGLKKLPQGPIKGSQGFQKSSNQIVGQPLMHLSAVEQATGEARYVDDLPSIDGEGFAGLVLSEAAHASFTVDYSGLEKMEGIIGYVSAQDVPSCNITGLGNDEVIFADKKVTSVGQLIAIVIAKSKPLAQKAVQAIKVSYTHLPAILTMEEAIATKSFYKPERCIKYGNVEEAFKSSDNVKEGEMRLGGQEQFYMETFSCLAIPKGEHKEIEIIASTQNLSECQKFVAKALGVPQNCVTVKITRLGGGFGGKDSRCNIAYSGVAVAANKFQIPVRMVMTRSQDMIYSGARHPVIGKYKVGFSKEGKIEGLDIDIYLNGGYSEDLSIRVMEATVVNIQSVYHIPHANIRGHVCRTNLPSNTAMRGFGTPEALMIMETILSHVTDSLQVEDKVIIQELNFLKNGQKFVYGMKVENSTISRCMDTLLTKCQYNDKKKEIEQFNKENKWKKRGISVVPTIQGIGFFEYLPLNQSGALVHVYTDGSVLLTHGGIEMGQGLHTKMCQVCAKCFNIPISKVHVSETSTDKVPNMIPTSASCSTDYNGMAVQDACQQILNEMKPFIESNPNGTWEEWVQSSYEGRVSLSARGYYKTPDFGIKFNEDGRTEGSAYPYHTYGAGCSIVEIDTLTGSSQILRSDLLMDVGDSLNPAIDIGQVEGAFTQGLGLFTMEELLYSPTDGQLCTDGPDKYKIPSCGDVPIELNVSLLDRCPNPKAIFSSKGIGEPPLFLAASVFFAIKEAVKSARAEVDECNNNNYFEFYSPATPERIRLSCRNQFHNMIQSTKQ